MFFSYIAAPNQPNIFTSRQIQASNLETIPEVNLGAWEGMLAAKQLDIELANVILIALHGHLQVRALKGGMSYSA